MRKCQVSIKVTRFGDQIPDSVVKEDFEEMKEMGEKENELNWYEISTYTDSNDIFEALAAAYLNILNQIKKEQDLPKFGDEGRIVQHYDYKVK